MHAAHLSNHLFFVLYRILSRLLQLLYLYLFAQITSQVNDSLISLRRLLLKYLRADILPFRRKFTQQVVEEGLTSNFLLTRVCVYGTLDVLRNLRFPLFLGLSQGKMGKLLKLRNKSRETCNFLAVILDPK